MKILNRPAPQAFAESVKYAEANLYSRAAELVGDRNPREHEFSVQLRAFDASKAGSSLGVAALLAMCSALINKSLRGGLVVVGGINLGGSIDPLHNAIDVVELAVEKGAVGGPDAGLVAEATFRPLRRHGHEGQRAVLRRRPRGVDQGDCGLMEWRCKAQPAVQRGGRGGFFRASHGQFNGIGLRPSHGACGATIPG